MSTGTEMERYDAPAPGGLVVMDQELTPEIFKARIEREQQLRDIFKKYVKDNMVEGYHYSTSLGTTKLEKPMLRQEGTRNICSLFKVFFGNPETTETFLDGGHFRVRAHVKLYNGDGKQIATGDAVCSTREKKYAYLTGARLCPECDQPTVRKDNKSPQGGFYCWNKPGVSNGCGANFAANDERITGQQTGRVENPDIADLENTVLKMAIKRAKTAAVCDVPMVSEIFAPEGGDGDDLPPANSNSSQRQPPPQSTRSSASRNTPAQSPASSQVSSAGSAVAEQGSSPERPALLKQVFDLLKIKCGDGETVDEEESAKVLGDRNPNSMNPGDLQQLIGELQSM